MFRRFENVCQQLIKCVFLSHSIGTTLSREETLDNATYPTAGLRNWESITKVMWGRVCHMSHNFMNCKAIASHNWVIRLSIMVYGKCWYYFFSTLDKYMLSFALSDFPYHSINDWSFFTSNMKPKKQLFKLKEFFYYESLEIIFRISILVKNL